MYSPSQTIAERPYRSFFPCPQGRWSVGFLTLAVGTLVMAGPMVRADALSDANKRGKSAVCAFTPAASTQNQDGHNSLARIATRSMLSKLKGAEVPVCSRIGEDSSDDLRIRFARKQGATYILSGRLTDLKTQIKNEFVQKLCRTTVKMQVELVDTRSKKPVLSETQEGLYSYKLDEKAGRNSQPSPFDYNEGVMLAEQAVLDGSEKLARRIAQKYPTEEISTQNVAQGLEMTVQVEAKDSDDAAKSGVKALFERLVSRPSAKDTGVLQTDILPTASRLVTVRPGAQQGSYEVAVPVDDLQSEGPNLIRSLIKARCIELPTVAVLCADDPVETALRGKLERAGFSVKDPARLAKLREREYVSQMIEGTADPHLLQTLKDELGVDYLIFASSLVEPLGNSDGLLAFNARVRTKIIAADTADSISSGDTSESDEDRTPAIAKERAQATAAGLQAEKMILDFYRFVKRPGGQRQLEITLTGWKALSQTSRFIRELEALPGFGSVLTKKYTEATLRLTIEIGADLRKVIGEKLEMDARFKGFGIQLTEDTATALRGSVRAVR